MQPQTCAEHLATSPPTRALLWPGPDHIPVRPGAPHLPGSSACRRQPDPPALSRHASCEPEAMGKRMGEAMQELRGSVRPRAAPETAGVPLPAEVGVSGRREGAEVAAHPHHHPQGGSGGPTESRGHPCGTGRPCQGSRGSLGERPPAPSAWGRGSYPRAAAPPSPAGCDPSGSVSSRRLEAQPDLPVWRTALSTLPRKRREVWAMLFSISVQGPSITGAAAWFLGCVVSRTSCPDMELLLPAPLLLLKYA